MSELLELSDLIVDYDPIDGQRRAVAREQVLDRLHASGQRRAQQLARALPHDGRYLNAVACDAILYRAHVELQRLNEEFLQGERLLSVIKPLITGLKAAGERPPFRVVDVGCGLGYSVRWLAANGGLSSEVEWVGCDLNVDLINHARRLAAEEGIACQFVSGNAFALPVPGHVFTSCGVVHHFRHNELSDFFRAQKQALAMVHYDIQRTTLAPLGSWLYHVARMREPLARHDGVVSALRAYSASELLEAARTGVTRGMCQRV